MVLPLLDRLARDLHVYISDLRVDSQVAWRAIELLEQLYTNSYDIVEWNIALTYILGVQCSFPDIQSVQAALRDYTAQRRR